MNKKVLVRSTYGKVFEKVRMVLFNSYPELVNKLGAFDDEPLLIGYDEDKSEPDEIYQWYIVNPSDAEWLESLGLEDMIKYSEALGSWILGISHWGTPWDGVPLEIVVDEAVADYWKVED